MQTERMRSKHMHMKRIPIILLALIIILSCPPARAEFSPRYTAWMQAESIEIELSAAIDHLSPLSDSSLTVINEWLGRIRLLLSASESSQRSLVRGGISMDGAEIYSVTLQDQPGYTLAAFSPSGNIYLTADGEKDALTLISGGAAVPLSPLAVWDVYEQWAPALYPLLEGMVTPKASKTTTSIKNANMSASYINYSFKADEMNAAWPQILSTLLPLMENALTQQPEWCREAESLLSNLVFSGDCRFKRFLDKQGGDMGLQFTGNAAIGDDVRKVTFFGGYTPDKGGYVSLALPAVKGKDNFKVTFTGKLSQKDNQKTLTLEGTYTRTLNGETHTASLEGSLKNALKKGDEAWSGKLTLTNKQDGVSDTWAVTPDLAFTDTGLQGKITLQQKRAGDTIFKGAVTLHMRPASLVNPPTSMAAKDLRGVEEPRARAIAAQELIPLTRAFMDLLAALPEETRILLTHDLRTDSWMTAPSVSPDGGREENAETSQPIHPDPWPEEGQWVVEEDPWAGESYWIVKEDTAP